LKKPDFHRSRLRLQVRFSSQEKMHPTVFSLSFQEDLSEAENLYSLKYLFHQAVFFYFDALDSNFNFSKGLSGHIKPLLSIILNLR